jgi:protein-L-isoaspartate(D-aspartate) O-methyltransferase
MTNEYLIKQLAAKGLLKTPQIAQAFKIMDRAHFVKQEFESRAYDDAPLPIESGQTISQPSTVAFMLELLQPQAGEIIMDVGAGSGWTTALLSHIVGPTGKVYGVEILPTLIDLGRRNLEKVQTKNALIQKANTELGLRAHAPYDKILVSAAAYELPQELVSQLKVGGIMVIPVKNSILKITKTDDAHIESEEFTGFAFVPLI